MFTDGTLKWKGNLHVFILQDKSADYGHRDSFRQTDAFIEWFMNLSNISCVLQLATRCALFCSLPC